LRVYLGEIFLMNKRYNSRGAQPRRNALVIALAMGLGFTGFAYGQATTGSIFGTAPVAAGETVVVTGANGTNRSVSVDQSGRYVVSGLPVGRYTVTLQKDGQTVASRENVGISVGGGTEVPFAGASAENAQNLGEVQVVASALPAIDVTSVNSSTIITAADLQKLPVGRSAESIALLAPGTVQGSAGFGNVVSFGGASVTENAYYVNGFTTGEPYRNLGGFQLPYGSIDQQQTYTGGYSAQYGRSDGGVINQIGKRGTNEWHFGGQVSWAPKFAQSSPENVRYPNPTIPGAVGGRDFALDNPDLPGTLYRYRNHNKSWETIYDAYVGGPLVKDKLYAFISAETTKSKGTNTGSIDSGKTHFYTDHSSKFYGKLDWNIDDSNVLELTKLRSKEANGTGSTYNFDYDTLQATDFVSPADRIENNADITIAKYTSYIGDNATLSVVYGRGKFDNPITYGYQKDLPFISRASSGNPAFANYGATNDQTNTSLYSPASTNDTKGLRVDFSYQLGDHLLGVGIDNMTYGAHDQGTYASGPGASISDPFNPASGYFWSYTSSANDDGSRHYFARQVHFAKLTSMTMDQKAYYLQDVWNVTDNFQLNLGVRNDRFTNYNDLGKAFVDEKNQWEPRIGASWDVNGDSSFKVYGNVGRYYLALPDNAAERAANRSTYLFTYYDYTGIDENGIPTGLTKTRDAFSPDGETGAPKDPKQVTSANLRAQYQDEYILGFDKTLGADWVYGAKVTYRDLKTAIDDECSPGRIADKMRAQGITDAQIGSDYYDSLYGAAYCRLINPGQSNDMLIQNATTGGYTTVTMNQADWGYTQGPKRTYEALDLYLEHPFDGKWQGRIDYTLARAHGNTEGQVRSDFVQGDVSKTEDWDSWQLMEGQDGELLNMRKHSLRARGAYQISPDWLVSGTLLVQSGTPKECLGYYGPNADGDPTGYNAGGDGNYHWCAGKIVHPGDVGHTPWTKQLNLGLRYSPSFAEHKLALQLQVYNVLNEQKALQVEPAGESGDHIINNQYQIGRYFESPRYVRLSVSYDY
jgi:hypothetical protein